MAKIINFPIRSVVGIRCIRIGIPEIRLKSLLLKFFKSEDIYFVIDGRAIDFSAQQHAGNVVVVNPAHLGLHACDDWGWRCGDFFYYSLCNATEADYYLIIEPDVWLTENTAAELFVLVNQLDSDFVAYNIYIANHDWFWHKTMAGHSKSIYKCAFPFSRLSKRAVLHLHEKRKILDRLISASGGIYPNDEAFVATTICNNDCFEFLSLESLPGLRFGLFSTMNVRPIEVCNVDGYIFHSVLDFDDFLVKFKKLALKIHDKQKIYRMFEFSFGGAGFRQDMLDKFESNIEGQLCIDFKSWRIEKSI